MRVFFAKKDKPIFIIIDEDVTKEYSKIYDMQNNKIRFLTNTTISLFSRELGNYEKNT